MILTFPIYLSCFTRPVIWIVCPLVKHKLPYWHLYTFRFLRSRESRPQSQRPLSTLLPAQLPPPWPLFFPSCHTRPHTARDHHRGSDTPWSPRQRGGSHSTGSHSPSSLPPSTIPYIAQPIPSDAYPTPSGTTATATGMKPLRWDLLYFHIYSCWNACFIFMLIV